MITHIDGKLVEKNPAYVVIDCGGVGYQLNISLQTFSKITDSERCKLYTHLAIREDAHVLFGFFDKEERELFLNLTSVSGVGPSTARMMLSSLSSPEIQNAIIEQNVGLLQSIKGIGAKTAQRIVIDLKDKLQKQGTKITELIFTQHNTHRPEALSALVALGFAKSQAEKALDKVLKTANSETTIEQILKLALKNI